MEGKWEKNGMGKMENSGKQGKKGEGNADAESLEVATLLCQTHILRDNLAPKAYKIYTTKTNYPESLITAVNRN